MKNKVINSYRVAYENWFDGGRFSELLAIFERYHDTVDQIAFFTSATHPPLTLEETGKRTVVLADRIRQTKERGFSCGINILGTIGHHCEDLDNNLNASYTHMTNIDGLQGMGTYCMNDPAFLDGYVKPVYIMLAKADPEFIWIDDDVRYGHMPIGNGCFCDRCMRIFNSENGTGYTRETLRQTLNEFNVPLRKKWLSHQSETISRLFITIHETVEAVKSDIMLGFMTGERYYEGYDFKEWADALSDNGRKPIMWRPGGGSYTDDVLDELVEKSAQIGRQAAYLPDYVKSIQSELENFPYQLLKKSPRSTALEAAMHISTGCTGTAFNILPSETGEPVTNAEKHIKEIAKTTGFYTILSETFGRSRPTGIHTGWIPGSQSAVPGDFINGYGGMYAAYAREMFGFGLPEAYHFDAAAAYTLTGNGVYALTEAQVLKILETGVYLDTGALNALHELGYGEYVGFKTGENIPVDARELFLPHPINNGMESGLRNCRQAFNRGDSAALLPADGAEILCSLVDYHDKTLADCSLGMFRNKLGGLIVAAGYYPFTWISDMYKTEQLKRVFRILSKGRIPCIVETYARIRSIARPLSDGNIAISLLNKNLDYLENICISVLTDAETIIVTDMRCNETAVKADIINEKTRTFVIPEIKPWEMCLIKTRK